MSLFHLLRRLVFPKKSQYIEEFVETAYQIIFQRPADLGGKRLYSKALLSGEMSFLQVLEDLQNSDEHKNKLASPQIVLQADVFSKHQQSAELSKVLQKEHLNLAAYQTYWEQVFLCDDELVIGQQEYGNVHKQRFYELFNAVSRLLRQVDSDIPNILEFGVSEFSALYGVLFPKAQVDFADRPVPEDYVGFSEGRVRKKFNFRNYYTIDLEQPLSSFDAAGVPGNHYDVIVIAEVLEHLVVHPVELFQQLLSLIHSDGYIYLTTPNFFSAKNIQRLQANRSPVDYYPEGDGNWDAHYHYREYSALEIDEIITQVGGRLLGGYFSDCWDTDKTLPPQQKGNMVFVIGKG